VAEVVGDAIERTLPARHEGEDQQRDVVEEGKRQRLIEVQQSNGHSGHEEVDEYQREADPVKLRFQLQSVAEPKRVHSPCNGNETSCRTGAAQK